MFRVEIPHLHHVTARYATEQLGTEGTCAGAGFGAAKRWRSEPELDRLGPGGDDGRVPAMSQIPIGWLIEGFEQTPLRTGMIDGYSMINIYKVVPPQL